MALTPLDSITEVSYDARWVSGPLGTDDATVPRAAWGYSAVLDRVTGAQTRLDMDSFQFIRDNPNLVMTPSGFDEPGARLINRATGTDQRIDTDSAGQPITASWAPAVDRCCEDECGFTDEAGAVAVGPESVSQDDSLVAFCANYTAADHIVLYLKNMATGQLRDTGVACGLDATPWDSVAPPEIVADGSVIHVRGNSRAGYNASTGRRFVIYYGRDTLYFPAGAGSARTIAGRGSMTRDGGTVFMRVGVINQGEADKTGGKVGAYAVATQKVTKLPGKARIYGTPAEEFSAFQKASLRGRFVVERNGQRVIDRKSKRWAKIAKTLGANGMVLNPERPGAAISGDGTTVMVNVIDHQLARVAAVKFR